MRLQNTSSPTGALLCGADLVPTLSDKQNSIQIRTEVTRGRAEATSFAGSEVTTGHGDDVVVEKQGGGATATAVSPVSVARRGLLLVLAFGDHMQNLYEYKLYNYNKLEQPAITQIYVVRALGGCFTDLWGRSLAKRVGWKLSTPLLLALLTQSCLRETNQLHTLMISKILAKVSQG
ncbi:hypothetical protein HPB51_018994 [Rhipicephalus microplus]|uniref:Uncharacterized protein n=1 Tax=Rhipicephalus microplus TaxID=6941 RepID=A0A9J6D6G6_RHIMP|nr:hypothetical protein HPB51_018994 [Rhipicephalus microplus]